jgi:hypothetical protein
MKRIFDASGPALSFRASDQTFNLLGSIGCKEFVFERKRLAGNAT